jgi:hypothetical protein
MRSTVEISSALSRRPLELSPYPGATAAATRGTAFFMLLGMVV